MPWPPSDQRSRRAERRLGCERRRTADLYRRAVHLLAMTPMLRVARMAWKPISEVLFGRRHPRSFYGHPEGGTSSKLSSEAETARLRMEGNSYGG